MLKLFGGGKPDHPMADPKEAKRLLEDLPPHDPLKALEELAHWFESVSTAEGFKLEQRVHVLLQIDEAGQARARKLARDYFATARPSKVQENRLWKGIHDYWSQAGQAFGLAVDQFVTGAKGADAAKAQLPLLLVRTLHSLSQRIKWMHMRYGPVDLSAWGVFNRVYGFAEFRGLAGAKVVVYPGLPGESTPQQEFLKGVVFSASSPDALLPLQVELAERLIGDFTAKFTLGSAPSPEMNYWIDINQNMAPQRLVRPPQQTPTLRCFGASAALEEVKGFIQKIESGRQVPSSLNLGDAYEPEVVLDVLEHLAMYWSLEPPERKHPRHMVKSRLSVSHGFDGLLGVLGESASLDFEASGVETWIVENVSAGGFGAVVQQLKGDWLKVGALIVMQPEGGNNWVAGIIRRVNKVGATQARVGIQSISKAPAAGKFWTGATTETGVLLKTGEPDSGEVRIVLKPGVFVPGQNLESERGGRFHVYMPQAVEDRGDDYEIARFREMIREN
ncbi:MAG: hypothetical protein JSS40_02320 [Proteobacteria bacterium]|nr:hypothetical protein [Pseudomonadota bacterium]